VADQARIPVIVHGQPEEAVIRLAQHPNIMAVVEGSGEPERVVRLKPSLDVLTGSEDALWSSLSAGAVGAVLAYANAAPYSTISIWEAHRGRHSETGLDWQDRVTRAWLVTSKYGVPGLKHAMDLNGYYGGPCRLPLAPPTPEAKREIEAAFRDLKG
jgi:4-hydroxy-2-oxoglutarate aldolase